VRTGARVSAVHARSHHQTPSHPSLRTGDMECHRLSTSLVGLQFRVAQLAGASNAHQELFERPSLESMKLRRTLRRTDAWCMLRGSDCSFQRLPECHRLCLGSTATTRSQGKRKPARCEPRLTGRAAVRSCVHHWRNVTMPCSSAHAA